MTEKVSVRTDASKADVAKQPDAPKPTASDGTAIVVDSKGRSLKIKPLDVLYESRLTRTLGGEVAMNMAYMLGFVFPAASVCEIDGEEVPAPQTQREIDASIQRLGREGLTAVMTYMQEKVGTQVETEAGIKN